MFIFVYSWLFFMKKTIFLTCAFVAMLLACKKDDIDPNQFLFNEDAMYGNSDAADKI